MKIVRWQDQERVDQNDMEAHSDLIVGEFRRTLRALLLQNETSTGIIRGFKVEPQAVPDSTVRVRLNPGTQPGAALLAENDGSIITRGQLAGDRGAQAALEGNASYTIDFSLDSPGTYVVEATFLYSDGETDNRAFWNDSTNLEYIASVATRRLPTLSIVRRSAPAGGEWTTLASVVWAGIPIVSGVITDQRDLLFEGVFPNFQTTQSGAGGMPDFDRSAARADVTNDAVYSALRKIGRQIQDLKGPNASGQWDFHSRVIKPMDPGNILGAGVTKSVATLDTLEYTVGDGTTTWGDFSGANGLQLCLAHIQTAQASLPPRIRIRLKSRRTAISDTAIWTLTTGFAFTVTKHLEIIGDCSGSESVSGRVPIAAVAAANQFDFTASAAGSLTLRNIKVVNLPTLSFFLGGDTSRLLLDNCFLVAQTVTVDTNCTAVVWSNSEIYGAVRMSHDVSTSVIDGSQFTNCVFGSKNILGTIVDGYLRLWRGASNLVASATTFTAQATFANCDFRYDLYDLPASTTREAHVDLRGASQCVFSNCGFNMSENSNGVLLGNTVVDVGNGSKNITFANCDFEVSGTQSSVTGHGVLAGYNTSEGTGWGVFGETLISTPTITSALISCFMRNIAFSNCAFRGCAKIDSGGIKLKNGTVGCSIENCVFENVDFVADAGFSSLRRVYFISVVQDVAYVNYPTSALNVTNCQFGRVASAGTFVPDVRHINLNRVQNVNVDSSNFSCSTLAGASHKTTWAAGTSEMFGVIMSRCFDVYISKCTFSHFPGTVLGAAIAQSGTDVASTYASRFSILSNHFENCTYGFLLISNSRSLITFDGNTFDAFTSNTARLFKANTRLEALSVLRFRNNTVVKPPGATWTVVELGDPARVIFTGNDLSVDGRIIHDSGMPGNVIGWNTTPQMNLVAAWA